MVDVHMAMVTLFRNLHCFYTLKQLGKQNRSNSFGEAKPFRQLSCRQLDQASGASSKTPFW